MGAKIEIYFLTNKNNSDVLVDILHELFNVGINYNGYVRGEYSYWIDGPIWEFGESITVTEEKLNEFKELREINSIINVLSIGFSPTITLGAKWFDKTITFILSIYESEKDWREVKISVDRYEVFDSVDIMRRENTINKLSEIFYKVALSIKPHYGVAATEIMGLVASPDELLIDNNSLGDFNYFDSSLLSKVKLENVISDYNIFKLPDGCVFLYKREGILELG